MNYHLYKSFMNCKGPALIERDSNERTTRSLTEQILLFWIHFSCRACNFTHYCAVALIDTSGVCVLDRCWAVHRTVRSVDWIMIWRSAIIWSLNLILETKRKAFHRYPPTKKRWLNCCGKH